MYKLHLTFWAIFWYKEMRLILNKYDTLIMYNNGPKIEVPLYLWVSDSRMLHLHFQFVVCPYDDS